MAAERVTSWWHWQYKVAFSSKISEGATEDVTVWMKCDCWDSPRDGNPPRISIPRNVVL